MGNKLFQEAKIAVQNASNAYGNDQQTKILQAKNALSSAFANSTAAEQSQLSEMQAAIDDTMKS
ncbi:DUF3813 domain-containing protein [Bacillus sp. Bva_UNVM-123]|uniref:DUF3813 domain-containing protein n=1 Tax=Bacillus sp. Bva_UNVM-123 TaxID=2829798 RepID=UPI00391F1571